MWTAAIGKHSISVLYCIGLCLLVVHTIIFVFNSHNLHTLMTIHFIISVTAIIFYIGHRRSLVKYDTHP